MSRLPGRPPANLAPGLGIFVGATAFSLTTVPGQDSGRMSQKENFWSSWQERLSALRNVPPVLKIVWDSGPGVVAFGIVARIIAALLPVALGYIPKLIIDILERVLHAHSEVPVRLWW